MAMGKLDRRQLLELAGAAVAASAFASEVQPVRAAGRARPRSIRMAVKLGMLAGEASIEEKFRLLREVGFEGVELDSPSELDPVEVLAARAKTGIEIPGVVDSVHWQATLGDPDAAVRARGVEALRTALGECKRYGGTSVLLVPAVVNAKIAYDDAWKRSQEELRKVLPLAAELEVHIAIENVWNQFLQSPLEAARYVDDFESPWVGWHFDVGNVVNYGWPEQWIRILGKRILKLDVKEYSRAKRDAEGLWKGFEVEIGEGDCGWPQVRAALEEIGYQGWATAEVRGGGRERLREIRERMERVLSPDEPARR